MSEQLKNNVELLLSQTSSAGVKLIAVTKTVSVDVINEAIGYGIYAIGENKVQELLEKYDKLNKENLEIHLIGKLQTNKVKYIIDKVDMIHSVDSLKLATTINRYAENINKIQDILVQVNISKEETKSGIFEEQLTDFLVEVSKLKNVKVRGLMCIPSPQQNAGDNAVYFNTMHKLLVDNNGKKLDNIIMDTLSMGMSDDYLTAIECGTNIVRVGSKIFGKRNYQEV